MKKTITILLLMYVYLGIAQDKIFVHTATTSNISISGHITYLDHPDINGNPNAPIVFSHVWNPDGALTGVYNDNIDGLWYDYSTGKWAIYNEDGSPMVNGASFFVYIASNPSDVTTHVADATNIIGLGNGTAINDPGFNGLYPGPYAVFSHYFNPHDVYNPHLYGFVYDDVSDKRALATEDASSIPNNAGFRILKKLSCSNCFDEISTTSNIYNNYFIIDNSLLNNNPDAAFVFSHYVNSFDISSTAFLNKKLSTFYSVSFQKWGIYIEDNTVTMPEDIAIDIIVAPRDTTNAVTEQTSDLNLTIFPNPVQNKLYLDSKQPIKQVDIIDVTGKQILHLEKEKNIVNIDVSKLKPGMYFVKVYTKNGQSFQKRFLKK